MAVPRALLERPALEVAPLLLGATVVSTVGGHEVVVRITEVEAYEGELDPASHAFRGRTKRTGVMFGPPGRLYCYFVYGMHWCANVVCDSDGTAAAVLLRGAEVTVGSVVAAARAPGPVPPAKLASGPARLARSLGLTGEQTGIDLLDPAASVRLSEVATASDYLSGPRVGVAAGALEPWRFWLPDEPSVSPYRPGGRKRARATRQTEPP